MANTPWLKARQTKFAAYAVVYTLIVVAIVSGVNFLANRYNKTFDATSNKKFTLSDETEKIAKNLKQPLTITYWDKAGNFDSAHDLLDRYKNLSSKIDVQYQDVDKNKTRAMAAGVKTYGTIFVNVGDKQQEAKSLSEEEVTGAMVRAIKGGERTACFTLDAGEHSVADTDSKGYSQVKDQLERNNYKTDTLHLLQKAEIPSTCTVVIVGGPRRDYIQPAVDAIQKYEENGGRLLVMLDPPLQFAQAEVDNNDALLKVLGDWGVTVDKDLILDTSQIGQLFGLGPEYALVTSYESHAIVRDMKDVPTGFPIARSLDIKNGDHTTVEKLFETSDNSFATPDLKSPEIKPGKNDKKGPLTLAAAGTFTSAKEGGNGRFVVVGSSSWIINGFLRFNGNRDLFLNMMNWLSSDEDLISIRPKDTQDRPLTMSARQMSLVFYESIVAIPLIIIVAGVGVWWKRR
ncbi:MAG TPA: GldG family protein [Bryobacteraceae bacterium]|nr:GldG family protein [Bryobacteraceae bacterium]